jgi:hypothetical protein
LILNDPTPAPALVAEVKAVANVGDLVKVSGSSAVYFIDNDNRRHAFPTEADYYSWFVDFSSVKSISSSVLAMIPLGKNVTMRPGTFLVKITTDPKVYAVEPYGVLRWLSTESAAIALYGANWGSRVRDVSDAFFVNYQVGTALDGSAHPDGSLIQYAGDTAAYYFEGGVKRFVDSASFVGNLFQNKFKATDISTSISYPTGDALPIIPIEILLRIK